MARCDYRQPTPNAIGLVIRFGSKGRIDLLPLLHREAVMGIALDIHQQKIDQKF
jgi:hypothetical protein